MRDLDLVTPDWMADALCTQVGDPELFFPAAGGNPRPAKAVCGACPVRGDCLDQALALSRAGSPVSGIWGGTSENERRRLLSGVDRACRDCGAPIEPSRRGGSRCCDDCRARRIAESQAKHKRNRRTA